MIVDVMDLDLEVINLPRHYESSRRAKGKTLYNTQRVTINEVDKAKDGVITVEANVEGDLAYYDVHLEIKKGFLSEYSCDCPDFDKGNICKHIIATCMEVIDPHYANTKEGKIKLKEKREKEMQEYMRLNQLRMEEERKKREYQSRYYRALNAINEYKKEEQLSNSLNNITDNMDIHALYTLTKKNMSSATNKPLATSIKIALQIDITNSNSMEITFKIGQNRMYVIKDMLELYKAFSKALTLDYGKELKFIAKKENFDNEDIELLEFILQYGEMLDYNNQLNSNGYYYSYRTSSKTMKIYETKMDEFFDIVKNRTLPIRNYGEYVNYTFSDEKLDIQVVLEKMKDSNDYELKLNQTDITYLISTSKIYILKNGKIYILEKEEQLTNVLKIFVNSNELLIPEDKFQEFCTYIFPKISKYLETTQLATTEQEKQVYEAILINKLASKMYLDVDNKDNIIMELKFCYKNSEFNVLDPQYANKAKRLHIERNIADEKKVLTRIFMDGFEMAKGKEYFILKDLDATYEFLSNKINAYMNDFEILVTDKLKNKEIKTPKLSGVSVRLQNDLLELDISKLDFDINEVKDVLKNYSIKKKYYKLKNGDFLSLENSEDLDFLNNIINSFEVDYTKLNNGHIKLPVNRSVYLDQLLKKNKKINSSTNSEFSTLVDNIENMNFQDNIVIDKKFDGILRDYQKVGYKWLKTMENYKFGGILADDMGLRKNIASNSSFGF